MQIYDSSLFGGRLKTVLRKRGISQTVFAEKAGMTQASLSQIMNGERRANFTTIIRIANTAGLSIDKMVRVTT